MSAGREHAGGSDIELRSVLDSLPVGVVAFTPDGVVAFMNQQAADWLSVTIDEVEGQPIDSDRWDILNPDGTMMLPEDYALSKVLATGEPVIDERARLRVTGGREFDIATSAKPLFTDDGDGEVEFVVGTFEDVSETRTHENRLKASNSQLEALAGVLSHDLRSPLSVAIGYLDLARETGDLTHLDRVERAHDRMRELIDDLLLLARRGDDIGERTELDLAVVARDAWQHVETGDARLVTEPLPMHGDSNRLTQLFENLFRNSVEHGSTGPRSQAREDAVEHGSTGRRTQSGNAVEHGSTGPRSQAHEDAVEHGSTDGEPLTVRVGPLDDGFYVEDDGRGLPASVSEAVNAGSFGEGDGLGLGIVSAIAAGHGWRLTASAGADGGARFEFCQ